MSKSKSLILSLIFLVLSTSSFQVKALASLNFLVKPYLQLGNHPNILALESYDLIFVSDAINPKLKIYLKQANLNWQEQKKITVKQIGNFAKAEFYEYLCKLENVKPNLEFDYKIVENETVIFQAQAKSRSTGNTKFAVFGDLGYGSPGQKELAYNLFKRNVDFVLMPGDIVYRRGLVHEYLEKFFPVYNCDNPSIFSGAPLLRSIMFFPALGNHDMALTGADYKTDLSIHKDALGYFYFFDEPLNGVSLKHNPWLSVACSNKMKKQILNSTFDRFPAMANYSFDWGYAHILVLDANPYQDWKDPVLRQFVETDLLKAKACKWKFVCYHQPAFSSDPFHHQENHMRSLSDIFQKYGVDLVFTGHAHCYQRSYPLNFNTNNVENTNKQPSFILDKIYDGKKQTKPKGVIYLVTGSGGAPLYNPKVFKDNQEEFTNIYLGNDYSFTLVEETANSLKIKQVTASDQIIDEFIISK